MVAAGLASVFAVIGGLTVATADDHPTSQATVAPSLAPSDDPESDPATTTDPILAVQPSPAPAAQAPGQPHIVPGGQPAAQQARAGSSPQAVSPASAPSSSRSASSVVDRVEIIFAEPVRSATSAPASVMGYFRPRPWLIALFVGLAIAILYTLAAGFRAKRQLVRV